MAAMDVLAAWRGAKLGLRAHLVIFGLAIVIPALLYTAFVLSRYAQSVHASNARLLETARALSADVDREITASPPRAPSSTRTMWISTSRPRRHSGRGPVTSL